MVEIIHKAPDEKFCSECGAIIRAKAEICPRCGVRQIPTFVYGQTINSCHIGARKSRLVAALLALFLGSLGSHKFYLGKVGQGIIYLLFSWTAIPFFISLIEGILLLSMREETFHARYDRC